MSYWPWRILVFFERQNFLNNPPPIVSSRKYVVVFVRNVRSIIVTLRILIFKIIVFIITSMFGRLYVSVGIYLTRGKHLHDRIISLRGEGWTHKTS